MQSEAHTTIKICRYCRKEFEAWKPSLKLCSDLCRQNEAFDEELSLLNHWNRFNRKLNNSIGVKKAASKKQTKAASAAEILFTIDHNPPPLTNEQEKVSIKITMPVKRSLKAIRAANRLKFLCSIRTTKQS